MGVVNTQVLSNSHNHLAVSQITKFHFTTINDKDLIVLRLASRWSAFSNPLHYNETLNASQLPAKRTLTSVPLQDKTQTTFL